MNSDLKILLELLLLSNFPFKKLTRNLFKALCNPIYKHEKGIL